MNEIIFKFLYHITECVICTDWSMVVNHLHLNITTFADFQWELKIVLFYLKMTEEKRNGKKIRDLIFIKEFLLEFE